MGTFIFSSRISIYKIYILSLFDEVIFALSLSSHEPKFIDVVIFISLFSVVDIINFVL